MTTRLLVTFKQRIKELKLIPSKGGCFELKVNGALIYSKLQTGSFPDEKTIVQEVEARGKRG